METKITGIQLIKLPESVQKLKKVTHSVILNTQNFDANTQKLLISIDNKISEINSITKEAEIILKEKQKNESQTNFVSTDTYRVKGHIIDQETGKVFGSKLQEFHAKTQGFQHTSADELHTTSDLILGNYEHILEKWKRKNPEEKKNNIFIPKDVSEIGFEDNNKQDFNTKNKMDISNAFIPIVELLQNNINYQIVEDKKRYWPLDFNLDKDKRTPTVKKAKIDPRKQKISLKFVADKGNKNANDSDGGIISAHYYDEKGIYIKNIKINIKNYGEIFNLEIKKEENISKISFYANDNDAVFDGGVKNIFCGAIKISFDFLNELEYQVAKTLDIDNKQKDMFKATVLVESSNGVKELEDIAYIYLSLVNDQGFEIGLSRSNAYKNEQYMFMVHMYHLGYKKEYGNRIGTIKKNTASFGVRVEDFYNKYYYKFSDQVDTYCKFIDKKIFCKNPKTKYLGWHGQGNNVEDMQINDGINGQWETARQYYWLQEEYKVKERLVVNLKGFNHRQINASTCIYDMINILAYFKKHPEQFQSPVKKIPYDPDKL